MLLLAAVLGACSAGEPQKQVPSRQTGLKVVLIGWDGADWAIARPLMESGRMPFLKALVGRGAHGELHSMVPVLSPLLWTTAATGHPPEIHGVLDFLEPGPDGEAPRPITQNARQVPALWEMVGAAHRTAGVVGWWATHPVRELNGFMVSDQLSYTLVPEERVARQASASDAVFPARDRAEVLDRLVAADAVPGVVLERFGETDGRLREILAGGLTYHGALQSQLALHGQPDLLMIYYQGIDQVSHHFMHCATPPMEQCPDPDRRRFGATVERYYEFQDELLGELLAVLEPQTVVFLISDHGFLSAAARPRYLPPDVTGQPGRWHRTEGLFVLAGPVVRAGATEVPLSLLEVTPTVLQLLGLPAGTDMEPPRTDLLRTSHLERFTPESWSGWQEVVGLPRERAQAAPTDAQRRMEELTALGYLSGSGARVSTGSEGRPRTVAAHVNLASRWIETGALEAAVVELTAALVRSPDYAPAWMGLGEVHRREGRRAESVRAYSRAVEISGGATADPSLLLRWALVSAPESEEGARLADLLDQALLQRSESADLHAARGILLARGKHEVKAARERLRAALERQPAHAHALATLFALRQEKPVDSAIESFLRSALVSTPRAVMPRNWLALQLAGKGDIVEAERLLREAAKLSPDHVGTRINLGNLLGRADRSTEAAEEFRLALALAPSDLSARLGLATSEARNGRLEAARQTLEEAVPPQRDDIRLLNTLALVYRDLGQADHAAVTLRRSLERSPDQPAVREMLGSLESSR